MPEKLVGVVTHYFNGPSVAVVKVTEGEIALGDDVRFAGHSSAFTERVTSMEVEHRKVERAGAGEEVAIQVVSRVRQHDQVFKIVPE